MNRRSSLTYDERKKRAQSIRAAKAWVIGILLLGAGTGLLWLMWDRAIREFMIALWIFAIIGYFRVVCVIVTWMIQLTVVRKDDYIDEP